MFRRYRPQHARGRARRKAAAAVITLSAMAAVPVLVTVHSGDTLSSIAAKHCGGQAGDWTGIWAASHHRGLIGSNPDLIYPGQKVVIACKTASVPRQAADTATSPVTSTRDGDVSDAAAGSGGSYSSKPVSNTVHHSYSGGGHLSFAGLESLWVSAGGPSWAEWRAAEIAECESGGNQMATNPYSGAAGYFQILGQVYPGWIYDPYVNARNAVLKFQASGDTFAAWVCQ